MRTQIIYYCAYTYTRVRAPGLRHCAFRGAGVGLAAADPAAGVLAEVARRVKQIAAALGPYKLTSSRVAPLTR